LGISYSSRKIRGKVLNIIQLNVQIDWKAKYARNPPFSCYVQFPYSLPYENIVFNDKVSWLLKFSQTILRDAVILLRFNNINKQMLKNDYFKTLKERGVLVISIADV
jgi:hypothetical protein